MNTALYDVCTKVTVFQIESFYCPSHQRGMIGQNLIRSNVKMQQIKQEN